MLVLHERKSRVTLAARLVGKTAAETISVMLAVFARIELALRKSIQHDALDALHAGIYRKQENWVLNSDAKCNA